MTDGHMPDFVCFGLAAGTLIPAFRNKCRVRRSKRRGCVRACKVVGGWGDKCYRVLTFLVERLNTPWLVSAEEITTKGVSEHPLDAGKFERALTAVILVC